MLRWENGHKQTTKEAAFVFFLNVESKFDWAFLKLKEFSLSLSAVKSVTPFVFAFIYTVDANVQLAVFVQIVISYELKS